MDEIWFRPLVWMDYRLAVFFTVSIPIMLLMWALVKKVESIQKLLIIYWRVASLLMITVYLMIPAWPISFISGLAAQLLIPISLWFWVDLNEEIQDLRPSALKLALTSWRWAITVYSILGAIAIIPFLSCAFAEGAMKTPFCEVWLEPPWKYQSLFQANSQPGTLGFFGMIGLISYVIYLAYFVFIRLGKQGRSALEQ